MQHRLAARKLSMLQRKSLCCTAPHEHFAIGAAGKDPAKRGAPRSLRNWFSLPLQNLNLPRLQHKVFRLFWSASHRFIPSENGIMISRLVLQACVRWVLCLVAISCAVSSPRSASSTIVASDLPEKLHFFVICVSRHHCWIPPKKPSSFPELFQTYPKG